MAIKDGFSKLVSETRGKVKATNLDVKIKMINNKTHSEMKVLENKKDSIFLEIGKAVYKNSEQKQELDLQPMFIAIKEIEQFILYKQSKTDNDLEILQKEKDILDGKAAATAVCTTEAQDEITCPECHGKNEAGDMFCVFCSAPLRQLTPENEVVQEEESRKEKRICATCSYPIQEDDSFCNNCGARYF